MTHFIFIIGGNMTYYVIRHRGTPRYVSLTKETALAKMEELRLLYIKEHPLVKDMSSYWKINITEGEEVNIYGQR